MEDDLFFLKMEDDLKFFENERRPQFFENLRLPQNSGRPTENQNLLFPHLTSIFQNVPTKGKCCHP